MGKLSFAFGAGALLLLAACASPKDFETPAVRISTADGDVVCQLYQKNMTDWDRATAWPNKLTSAQADALCKAEGIKRMKQ